MKLVIVESPGKTKTIQKYLGSDFVVKASVGHIWKIVASDTAVDISNNYEPKYEIIKGQQTVANEIKNLAKKAEIVYVATDPDREGEAIGWHLAHRTIVDLNKVKRISFQEITKSAVLTALQNPRQLDENLFHAQQARSVLDLLVGFRVSPVLWSKVCRGTSAGRVQSIGLELIVERQKEIDAFVPEEYWEIAAKFQVKSEIFGAGYKSSTKLTNEAQVRGIESSIRLVKTWRVDSITKTRKSRSPAPPFTTSSLQQFGATTFGWSGKRTMAVAQKLYEGFSIGGKEATGLISYHRTDSLNVSTEAITTVRTLISTLGSSYLPASPRTYKSKGKNAQEAHEAIRPTHLEIRLDEIRASIDADEYKLYEAIWRRFVASQMSDAQYDTTKVEIKSDDRIHTFTASGRILVFEGFLKVFDIPDKDENLPVILEQEELLLKELTSAQHFTKPPACYNTASLVKKLEEEGVGRPSTYASIIDTLIKRTYIEERGPFIPTDLGKKVCVYLQKQFIELMDIGYTSRIENELDEIADGQKIWYEVVDKFFKELQKRLDEAYAVKKAVEVTDLICPICKKHKLVKQYSKYGHFYGCEGFKAKGADRCKSAFDIGPNGEPISKEERKQEILEGFNCSCGGRLIVRVARKSGKKFVGCEKFPKCNKIYDLEGKEILRKQ